MRGGRYLQGVPDSRRVDCHREQLVSSLLAPFNIALTVSWQGVPL